MEIGLIFFISRRANERIINSSGRMALRSGCLYSEIGSQMWRHNRAVEWTDLGFVGFCCERQFSVSNEGSKHLRVWALNRETQILFVSPVIVCGR